MSDAVNKAPISKYVPSWDRAKYPRNTFVGTPGSKDKSCTVSC